MSETQFDSCNGNIAVDTSKNVVQEMPNLDILKIIRLIGDIAKDDKSPMMATKELVKPYSAIVKDILRNRAMEIIDTGLEKIGLEALSNQGFSERLVGVSKKIVSIVTSYMHGEITERIFIAEIGDSGIKDVGMQILSTLGIHEKMGIDNPMKIMKLAPPVVAYVATMAAYKELRKAMDNLAATREKRIQIEAACQKSISMIRQYREEMEFVVSNYFKVRIETFESGFTAMDKALMDGDIDGYIKGNTEIQSILGYKMQFSNQDEFDALMQSDDVFQL